MPQERDNQYPNVTYEEWDSIKQGVSREVLAARVIIANQILGIPNRPYLLGQGDHAPIVKGVSEFAGVVYALLDALDHIEGGMPAVVEDAASEVARMMEEPKL